MRFPPWAIEALRKGVADVAKKASDAETVAKVRDQATELFRDLPESASRGLETLIKTASETAREAVHQGRELVSKWGEHPSDFGVPCWNASGVLLHSHGSGIAAKDPVLQPAIDLLRGNCIRRNPREQIDADLAQSFDRTGISIAVAGSLDAAVHSVSILREHYQLVLHRSQAIRLPSGLALPDVIGSEKILQCGGVQSLERSDFDGIESACLLLSDDGNREVELLDFDERDLLCIAIVPIGTLKDRFENVPSAEVLIRNGFDLVITAGGPLTGGAACGLIVGRDDLVEKMVGAPLFQSLSASDAVAAMTLAALNDSEPPAVGDLMETNIENLRSRAERFATRISAHEQIESCQIADEPASLTQSGRWQYLSRQVKVRHKSLSPESWAEKLIEHRPAIIATPCGEQLAIDFRWLPPHADSEIANALAPDET